MMLYIMLHVLLHRLSQLSQLLHALFIQMMKKS